eukprot:11099232-Alexandrium_andersonii.AAC.1
MCIRDRHLSDEQLHAISAQSAPRDVRPPVQDASVGHADAPMRSSGPSPPAPAGSLASSVVGARAGVHAEQLE